MKNPLIELDNVSVNYKVRTGSKCLVFNKYGSVNAVNNVSFKLYENQVISIVGESGCGKSTLAQAVLKLLPIAEGSLKWFGKDVTHLKDEQVRELRKDIQMIFQDPFASLNPRMTVFQIIKEPLQEFYPEISDNEAREQVTKCLIDVGLSEDALNRYPHEFSGGQCQRIGIARAIILKPKVIVCDEAVSALDVSIKAQIINLLNDLRQKLNLSLIFISHDLSTIKYISTDILVIYLGYQLEFLKAHNFYEVAKHPYTKSLINSIPIPDPELARKKFFEDYKDTSQDVFSSNMFFTGSCPYVNSCSIAKDRCFKNNPELKENKEDGTKVACFFV